MRQFITIDVLDESIEFHFPKEAELEYFEIGGAFIAHNFEEHIQVQQMGMQSGSVSWVVIYSAVDSPIEVRQGMVQALPFAEQLQVREMEINNALQELLAGWRSQYLPKEETNQ